jgi:hypothetical protein
MGWGTFAVTYIVLLIFGLLFIMGANARKTPPVSRRSRLKPGGMAAQPEITVEDAGSGILVGRGASARSSTRRTGTR